MYRIASNELISQWRRKYPELLGDDFDPAEPAFDQEDERLGALRECLEAVEGKFVEVVRGRIQGISTEELAQRHQISSKAVATRIHRGKQKVVPIGQKSNEPRNIGRWRLHLGYASLPPFVR